MFDAAGLFLCVVRMCWCWLKPAVWTPEYSALLAWWALNTKPSCFTTRFLLTHTATTNSIIPCYVRRQRNQWERTTASPVTPAWRSRTTTPPGSTAASVRQIIARNKPKNTRGAVELIKLLSSLRLPLRISNNSPNFIFYMLYLHNLVTENVSSASEYAQWWDRARSFYPHYWWLLSKISSC